MPRYAVILHGKDWRFHSDGDPMRGFYTCRYVNADSGSQAFASVCKRFLAEPIVAKFFRESKSHGKKTVLEFEEVFEVSKRKGKGRKPGFIFISGRRILVPTKRRTVRRETRRP